MLCHSLFSTCATLHIPHSEVSHYIHILRYAWLFYFNRSFYSNEKNSRKSTRFKFLHQTAFAIRRKHRSGNVTSNEKHYFGKLFATVIKGEGKEKPSWRIWCERRFRILDKSKKDQLCKLKTYRTLLFLTRVHLLFILVSSFFFEDRQPGKGIEYMAATLRDK